MVAINGAVPAPTTAHVTTATTGVTVHTPVVGVRCRGWVRANADGRMPSLPIPNSNRAATVIQAITTAMNDAVKPISRNGARNDIPLAAARSSIGSALFARASGPPKPATCV